MKKFLAHISNPATVLTLTLVVSILLLPQPAHASPVDFAAGAIEKALAILAGAVLKIFSLLTALSGMLLNFVMHYTIVDVADNYSKLPAINSAWTTIRDVANMSFIFILLYAAIQLILGIGKDTQKLIVKVVMVAILINFSMFFTKVVIDASNVLSITFYGAMAPGALESDSPIESGLSNAFMDHLEISSLYEAAGHTLDVGSIFTTGIMGSILLLIASFVFFAIAIMFIIRYVILIMVIILSPLAFTAMILPNSDKYFDKWKDALIGQAFFAPIYLMLTWISLKMLDGMFAANVFGPSEGAESALSGITLTATGADGAQGFLSTFMGFAVVIVFLIAALIISKDVANKAGPGVKNLTKWATGRAGNIAFGGAAKLGRGTIGLAGKAASDNVALQEAAKKERTGSWRTRVGFVDNTKGAAARLALYTSKKARSGSMDVRRASIPTSVIGDLAQGTVGRTKFGRTVGLDDVNIKNIDVGAFAANQTGVGQGQEGGYKEKKEEKEKRINTRARANADEYRKAQSKTKIKEGLSNNASPAEILEMQKMIKDMSNKEIVSLDANTLANTKVAEALTANHLKAIDDDKDNLSETEKREIFEKHFAKVADAADAIHAGTATNADKNIIKNISDKELSYIPSSIFDPTKLDPTNASAEGNRSRAILKTIGQGQVDSLTKSDKYLASEKQAIKTERARPLEDAFTNGNWSGSPDSAVELMRGMRPEALVQLDDAKLTNPNVIELYSPALLNKMAARSELTEGKARAIRNVIINAGPGIPGSDQEKAYTWLQGDGLNIF